MVVGVVFIGGGEVADSLPIGGICYKVSVNVEKCLHFLTIG